MCDLGISQCEWNMVVQVLNQLIVKQMNVYIEKSKHFLRLHITLRVAKLLRALASVSRIWLLKCLTCLL